MWVPYDTKQADGEALVILKLWEMQSTPSQLSLPGSVWPGVVASDWFGLVSLFNGILTFVGYLMPMLFS